MPDRISALDADTGSTGTLRHLPSSTLSSIWIFYTNPEGQLWKMDGDGNRAQRVADFNQGEGSSPTCFDVNPDGRRLLLIWRGGLTILDIRTGECRPLDIIAAEKQSYMNSPRWSPDGKRIAYIFGNEIWVLDPESGKANVLGSLFERYTSPPSASRWNVGVEAFAWSGDGRTIAANLLRLSGSGEAKITIIDSQTGEPVKKFDDPNAEYFGPGSTPKGEYFWVKRVYAPENKTFIEVYDIQSDSLKSMPHLAGVGIFAKQSWSEDGRYFATSVNSLHVYDSVTGNSLFCRENASNPCWLDDHAFVYSAPEGIWHMTIGDAEPELIMPGGFIPSGGQIVLKAK